MARVYAFRLLIALLALVAAVLLTSLAYELVATARWNPALAGEGKSRWALLQFQNSRRPKLSVGQAGRRAAALDDDDRQGIGRRDE